MRFAPRIAPRLHASIVRHAGSALTPAEITRRLGEEAEQCGLARPGYEQVRVLVRRARRARRSQWTFGIEFGVGVRVSGVPALERFATETVLRPFELLPRLRR